MTQLRKQYLTYYYTKDSKGKYVKHDYLNRRAFNLQRACTPSLAMQYWPYSPNGEFPVRHHDERGFLPKKGKRRNMTHARLKRRSKARRKAA